jgi:hypothetical protein
MTTPRIIPASELTPGLATIIVALPDRTIRSRALIVQPQPHGVVQVAFASGDVITLSARTMVGCIERTARKGGPPRSRRAS